ncbi:MAG: ATP-dependent DNA ligase, partial [bacterium]
MKLFAEFIESLDRTNKTNDKIEIIKDYFANVNEKDKLWTLYLLSGGKIKKKFNSSQLREWAIEFSRLPKWLFEESYHSVGDLAETIALILPEPLNKSDKTLTEWIEYIEAINNANDENRKEKITEAWNSLNQNERFVFNKLITGSFRIGVSQKTLINALSQTEDIEANIIAHRLMGNWHPAATTFPDLLSSKNLNDEISKPYPFFLAYSVEDNPERLGDPADWQAEWKWDGIRGQLIYRKGELFVWSRGEELVTDKFPELQYVKSILPDGIVLDGEIMCYGNNCPMPFNLLQTRIGRKNINQKILKEAPVVFMIYDILEYEGKDLREKFLTERIKILNNLERKTWDLGVLKLSEEISFENWEELRKIRSKSRDFFTEGIMLKNSSSV